VTDSEVLYSLICHAVWNIPTVMSMGRQLKISRTDASHSEVCKKHIDEMIPWLDITLNENMKIPDNIHITSITEHDLRNSFTVYYFDAIIKSHVVLKIGIRMKKTVQNVCFRI
jgi:hypothetical protein